MGVSHSSKSNIGAKKIAGEGAIAYTCLPRDPPGPSPQSQVLLFVGKLEVTSRIGVSHTSKINHPYNGNFRHCEQ